MRLAKSSSDATKIGNLTFGDDEMKRHENEIFSHGEPLSEE
jgi:hypothetical protein